MHCMELREAHFPFSLGSVTNTMSGGLASMFFMVFSFSTPVDNFNQFLFMYIPSLFLFFKK